MQTQTHALIGAYFFGKRDSGLMTAGAVAGMLPDLPMIAIVAILMLAGRPGQQIFNYDYFQPWWQHINGLSHSLILWPLALVFAVAARRHWPTVRWPEISVAMAAAGLTHAIIDFLCHREDAHMQFWPLSSWKFVSPISYYDRANFGGQVMVVEAALGLFLAWQLFKMAKRRWSRGLIAVVALPYLAMLPMAFAPARAEPAPADPESVPIGLFGSGTDGWTTMAIDKKVPMTRYRLVRSGGIAAIEARADRSQALFVRDVDVALAQTPVLCWRWRVAGVIDKGDIRTKNGDDQAARVLVGLTLPRSSLSFGTRMKLALGRAKFGKLLPDGALNYVWDNKAAIGTIAPNAYTDRARMVVVQSGNAQAGNWVNERRDVLADMQSQFGTTAGRMTLIALATDTDNTGGTAQASYADLHMVRRGAPCRFPSDQSGS
ncbi:DUF3047 domain-containing protein [Sphingomonas sp. 28-62-11]|uniref:DUF3047 domain-containing protein n=1 Tax=Sphingomonas sp. 28-62-11 TaxID=1970432 RepID=UPI000BD8A78F|nr:MAG: hypothetical protein B7Y49_12210 [Sphingomonas sp. 28-62-11]